MDVLKLKILIIFSVLALHSTNAMAKSQPPRCFIENVEIKELERDITIHDRFSFSFNKNVHFDEGKKACLNVSTSLGEACGRVVRASISEVVIDFKKDYGDIIIDICRRHEVQAERYPSVRIDYISTILSPVQFNILSYSAPSDSDAYNLWKVAEKSENNKFGISLSTKITSHIRLGAKYKHTADHVVFSDYDIRKQTDGSYLYHLFTEYQQSHASYSVFSDYLISNKSLTRNPKFRIKNRIGLESETSLITFNGYLENDQTATRTKLIEGTSTLSIMSLMFSNEIEYKVNKISVIGGINYLIPIMTIHDELELRFLDKQSFLVGDGIAYRNLFEEALNHRRKPVGIELVVGISGDL